MVSYYNHPFAMYQKNHSAGSNLPYSASPSAWYSSNYHHQPPNAAQFLDTDGPPQHMYHHYAPHMLPQPSPDWGHDNYTSSPQNGSLGTGSSGGVLGNSPGSAAFLSLNQAASAPNGSSDHHHMNDAIPSLPSPPVTVHSGSDMSSPGASGPSSSPQIPSRPTPVKSPYEWMKKPSYQSQPNPGKTRTKDKYRVVYTDHQRLELEKEFHYTRYITIRRKAELAQALGLSERQVKIWFQNRRAKDRKQKKKIDAGIPISMNGQTILTQSHVNSSNPHSNLSSLLDVKPKLEQSLHLQHLHQMSAMGMGMSQMGLHPHLHSHLPPPMPPTSSHSQSSPSPMMMN
ncbi:homeotic protein caudal-like isoform X2 [Chironomus tepperi]|uniref:homeotic protein caudal-like isoform X2 n=1 Tax=Chironomus tepperi TaxID=113505 RepID=UPI00391F1589